MSMFDCGTMFIMIYVDGALVAVGRLQGWEGKGSK